MKQNINPTTLYPVFPMMTAVILVLAGCAGNGINDTTGHEKIYSGTVKVSVHLGRIGTLAKRSVIEMEKLIIQITDKKTDSVVASDTSGISGNEETTVEKTFPDLCAPDTFKLSIKSVDTNGEIIHNGSKEFFTSPGDTVNLSLDLDAQYSMLRVSFNDIPDSVDKVVLMIDDVDTLDSSFTSGSRESIVFQYDYLEADEDGIEYDLSLKAGGSFYGNDTVLYAADTSIVAQSGVDTGFQVILKWVGPDIPCGAAELTVTIGTVGRTLINAGFEEGEGVIPTTGLSAYYPFNGDADDKSGNGLDGTVHGAALTQNRFGVSNAAYMFDGTDNYIDLGAVNPITGNHFTISIWFYLTDTISYEFGGWYGSSILMKGNDYNREDSYGIEIYTSGPTSFEDAITCAVVNTTGDTIRPSSCSSPGMLSANRWYHVVSILDDNTLKFYVDGELESTSTVSGQLTQSALELTIGRTATSGYEHSFKGQLDDIRIYDKALSDNEVLSLYHENGWTGN